MMGYVLAFLLGAFVCYITLSVLVAHVLRETARLLNRELALEDFRNEVDVEIKKRIDNVLS